MAIQATEDWLIHHCRTAMESLGYIAGNFSVDSGPYEWDGNYAKELLDTVPAVRVVFTGGDFRDETEPSVDLDWSVIVVTGWVGETQKERRRGDMAAYAICEMIAATIHNAVATADPTDLSSEPVARVRVLSVNNAGGGEWDRIGLAIYELAVTGEAELDRQAVLDDFLRARVAYDLVDEGIAEDVVDEFEIPQD